MQFQALMNLSDIEAISGEWAALLDRSTCNRAFGSPAWCLSAFRTSRASSPYVILARRGAVMASVFPLAITENGKEAVSPTLLSDYNDIICERDDLAAAAETLAYAVRGPRPYERTQSLAGAEGLELRACTRGPRRWPGRVFSS